MPIIFNKQICNAKTNLQKLRFYGYEFENLNNKQVTWLRILETPSSLDSSYLMCAEIAKYNVSRGCGHTHRLLVQQILNTNNAATSILWKKAFCHQRNFIFHLSPMQTHKEINTIYF
jgi:hypothetical protein